MAVNGLGSSDWKWHWTITNFPAAWDISRGSSSVKVVVIDSEFDTEHPDLKTKLAGGRNFDSGTADYHTGRVRATDINTSFHGSHVAGLVGAASDNAEGGPGACFDCVVIPYKIGFSGSLTNNVDEKFVRDLTEALTAAGDSDGVVINMSLGTSRDHAPLHAAVDYALLEGQGRRRVGRQLPAQRPGSVRRAELPRRLRGRDRRRRDAARRQHRALLDQRRLRGRRRRPATPSSRPGTRGSTPRSPVNKQPTHGIGYKALSGTSMASPITAGLAALMKTVRPDLTPAEVKALLEQSSDDLGAVGRDPVFGSGRINALRALQAAQAYVRPAPPPDTRKAVRFFWSCEQGSRDIAAGKPFVGVPVRAKLVCKGRTKPALRKVTLELQRYSARRGWKRIGVVKTTNKGRFGFTRKLGTVGNWRLRVAFGGSSTLLPSGSLGVKARAVARR